MNTLGLVRRSVSVSLVVALCVAVQVHAEQAEPWTPAPPASADLDIYQPEAKRLSPEAAAAYRPGPARSDAVEIVAQAGRWSPQTDDLGWLAADTLPSLPEYAVLLVDERVSSSLTNAVREAGAEPIAWYPNRALLLRLPAGQPGVVAGLAALPAARWLGRFPAHLKLHPEVSRLLQGLRDPMRLPGPALLRVALVSDTPAARASFARSAERLGHRVVNEDGVSLWLDGDLFGAEDLANLDSVIHVGPGWYTPSLHHDRTMALTYSDRARVSFDDLPEFGSSTRVAIIDSGYYPEHNALPPATGAKSFVNDNHWLAPFMEGDLAEPLEDGTGHATHIAGTIFGRRTEMNPSLRGVAPRTSNVWIARLFNDDGQSGDAQQALKWVANEAQADVANNSWGCCEDRDELEITCQINSEHAGTGFDAVYADRLAYETGISWVFSSGNFGYCSAVGELPETTLATPADAKNVITVGASRDRPYVVDRAYGYTSTGPTADFRHKPDLVAPGDKVTSSWIDGPDSTAAHSGTSMASPHVTGAVALLMEALPMVKRRPDAVKALLRSSAVALGNSDMDDQFGAGRLETFKLMANRDQSGGWAKHLALGPALQTGEVASFVIDVPDDAERMTVVMSWTDHESVVGAGNPDVNNLDLVVQGPDGAEELRAMRPWDTVETVIVREPAAGQWTVTVIGAEVREPLNHPAQKWAAAVTVDRGEPRGKAEPTLRCVPAVVQAGEYSSCSYDVTASEGIATGITVMRGPGVGWWITQSELWLRDGTSVSQWGDEAADPRIVLGDVVDSDTRSIEFTVRFDLPGEIPVRLLTYESQDMAPTITTFAVQVEE